MADAPTHCNIAGLLLIFALGFALPTAHNGGPAAAL